MITLRQGIKLPSLAFDLITSVSDTQEMNSVSLCMDQAGDFTEDLKLKGRKLTLAKVSGV